MVETSDADAEQSGPLSNLRVVEFGSTISGPFCARMLADFGATVIKVEQPDGDFARGIGSRKQGRSLYAASVFRGKRIVSIDLRIEKGRGVARRLCEKADIVVENFRPGTMERWGLSYEELSRSNPGLIFARISGFGQDGRYRGRPGYGVTCEAISGLRGVTGYNDLPPPRMGAAVGAYLAGLYGAFGILAAAMERMKTGNGQVVDSSMCEAAFSLMEPHIPAYQQLGIVAKPPGSHYLGTAPNTLYPAANGTYIHITAVSDSVFARLADLMEQPELVSDPRFTTALARSENAEFIDEIISAWTSSMTLEALESLLVKANVPAARIYSVADIFNDEYFRQRNMLIDMEDDVLGPVTLPGIIPKLSRTPGRVRWIGHQIGDDTRDILKAELGYTDSDIDDMAKDGVVTGPDIST